MLLTQIPVFRDVIPHWLAHGTPLQNVRNDLPDENMKMGSGNVGQRKN